MGVGEEFDSVQKKGVGQKTRLLLSLPKEYCVVPRFLETVPELVFIPENNLNPIEILF